jgi:hypothetical protein
MTVQDINKTVWSLLHHVSKNCQVTDLIITSNKKSLCRNWNNAMEQSALLEAVSHLASQFFICYRTERFITIFTSASHWLLSWVTWIWSTPSPPYFSKICCNIIVPPTARTSKGSIPFRFKNQMLICVSYPSHPCYMPCSSCSLWFEHPNNTWLSKQVMKLLIMQSSSASCHFLFLRSK